ncbi:MAG: GAF domain-containing protein, partial [Candidatus Aminicenantes bacterium]
MPNLARRIFGLVGGRKRRGPEPRTIFREFAESLNLIEDFDLIALNMLGTIKEAAAVDRLVLFIHDNDLGHFRVGAAAGFEAADLKGLTLSSQDKLVKWLKVNKTFLDAGRQGGVVGFLGEKDREMFRRLGFVLCFPILSMNRLIGILGVGPKASGAAYSAEEAAFIDSIMPQAGIALENALLYKEQRSTSSSFPSANRKRSPGRWAWPSTPPRADRP